MLCLSGFELYPRWVPLAPCEGIQDSSGFWIPSRGFWIPGSGFRIL